MAVALQFWSKNVANKFQPNDEIMQRLEKGNKKKFLGEIVQRFADIFCL